MYKIIGADQKEYGPITLEQMQQWIREGRVNAQTLVWSETGGNWKPLSTFPEFAGNYPGAPLGSLPTGLPGATFGGDRTSALEKVAGPATGLIIMGGLGLLVSLASLVMSVTGVDLNSFGMGGSPEAEQMTKMMGGTIGAASAILGIAMGAVVLLGALKLKKLESYGFSLAASILAMLPCSTSCCCLIGIPIGIWALVVINKPEIKSQFK